MVAIIIAAVVSMIIGGIWFGPKTFYPSMLKQLEISKAKQKENQKKFNPIIHFGGVFLAELLIASILYILLNIVDNQMLIVVLVPLIVVMSNVKTNIFTYMNLKLYLIQEGQKLISLVVMILIISLFI